jgi:hypothetical protein
MKKSIIAFVVILLAAFGLFAFEGMKSLDNNSAIAKAPITVLAVPEGITKKTKKSRESFQVNFSYTAAGTKYMKDSEWMDTQAQAEALGNSPVQIVYAAAAPAEGIFKSEFDKRDPKAGLMTELLTAAGMALIAALLGTLGLNWYFPWMRRP